MGATVIIEVKATGGKRRTMQKRKGGEEEKEEEEIDTEEAFWQQGELFADRYQSLLDSARKGFLNGDRVWAVLSLGLRSAEKAWRAGKEEGQEQTSGEENTMNDEEENTVDDDETHYDFRDETYPDVANLSGEEVEL